MKIGSASLAKVLTSAKPDKTPSNFFGKISSTTSSIIENARGVKARISRLDECSSIPISFNNAFTAALSVSSAEKFAAADTPFNAAINTCLNS